MSRLGKKPITVPAGVKVSIADNVVTVEGPKGKLQQAYKPEVTITYDAENASVQVANATGTRMAAAMHGLYWALIRNMIIGVTDGYQEKLEISGTGYLFAVQGQTLQVRAGFANEVHKPIPSGLTVTATDQQHLLVQGIDKQLVGMFAAEVRAIRKAEPYLGKGIKYEGETIRRKESKAAAKK